MILSVSRRTDIPNYYLQTRLIKLIQNIIGIGDCQFAVYGEYDNGVPSVSGIQKRHKGNPKQLSGLLQI